MLGCLRDTVGTLRMCWVERGKYTTASLTSPCHCEGLMVVLFAQTRQTVESRLVSNLLVYWQLHIPTGPGVSGTTWFSFAGLVYSCQSPIPFLSNGCPAKCTTYHICIMACPGGLHAFKSTSPMTTAGGVHPRRFYSGPTTTQLKKRHTHLTTGTLAQSQAEWVAIFRQRATSTPSERVE